MKIRKFSGVISEAVSKGYNIIDTKAAPRTGVNEHEEHSSITKNIHEEIQFVQAGRKREKGKYSVHLLT